MKKAATLVFMLGVLMMQPAWAAEDLLTSHLVDQARHWQQKDRDDIAAEIWRSVLRSAPSHGEALVKLGLIEVRAGNRPDAQLLLERANQVKPRTLGTTELAAALATGPSRQENAARPSLAQMSTNAETGVRASKKKTVPKKSKNDGSTDSGGLALKP